MENKDLYSGLIKLHILHHAAKEPVYGLALIEELGRHGYKISPGTIYPMLHRMAEYGYLKMSIQREGRTARRLYVITSKGRKALEQAKGRVRELFGELFEE